MRRLKAVILVGGVQKGTRFRPLSLQLPKPLFPIAGRPLVEHHIAQLCELGEELAEIYLLGSDPNEQFSGFIDECLLKYHIPIRYLEEGSRGGSLGTAGGLLKFRCELLKGDPSAVFVLNADACGDLPLPEMVAELKERPKAECLILTTEATREQSTNYGCVVIKSRSTDKDPAQPKAGRVLHYVDKPSTFVSTHISCGVYLLRTPGMWHQLERAAEETTRAGPDSTLWFETDVFPKMASNRMLYAIHTNRWWSQTKTAGAALYANRHYLKLYRERCPERLCSSGAEILGDVCIDPTAEIHPTAKIGPNVSIGANARIGAGVRIRESIVLQECVLNAHCCVLYSIVGWRSVIGEWARVEGTPTSPNPNVPFAKLENKPLFNSDGRLNPSLTILGSDVHVPKETVILNSVVLPHKQLVTSYKNQIIL